MVDLGGRREQLALCADLLHELTSWRQNQRNWAVASSADTNIKENSLH